MRNSIALTAAILILGPALCRGQVGGNITYSQPGGQGNPARRERLKRSVEPEKPPTGTSTFVEADVLMNVKADEFVAVFGVAQEAETVEECGRKMDANVSGFTEALRAIGIAKEDIYVDFVSQPRAYGFEISGEIAREKLVGFELKKNVSIRFRDRDRIEALARVAAKSHIHDLIKVDYVVRDLGAVEDRLMEAAAGIIKRKSARYERLLGIRLQAPAQVYAEKYATYFPTEMYDAYSAADTEAILSYADRQRYTIQSARKGRTSVFNGLDGDGFDEVVNPVLLEPVVQFTLHLKVKYEVEPPKAR